MIWDFVYAPDCASRDRSICVFGGGLFFANKIKFAGRDSRCWVGQNPKSDAWREKQTVPR